MTAAFPPASGPSPSRAWMTTGVLALAALLSYTDRQILNLLVDPIKADLGISDLQVSLLQGAAFAVLYAVFGLPLGRMADLWPRRMIIIAGVTIWSAATVACGLAEDFGSLFAARVTVGIGEAALAPAAISIIADSFQPKRRGLAIGVFLMGMVVGGGLAVAIGGGLLTAAEAGYFEGLPVVGGIAPWRAVFVIAGLAGIFVILALLLTREPPRGGRGADDAAPSLRATLLLFRERRGTLIPLFFGAAILSVADYGVLSWIPAYLSRTFELSAGQIGASVGAIAIATGVAGALGGGYFADRAAARSGPSGRLMLAAALAALGIPFSVFVAAPSVYVALALLVGWMFITAAAGIIAVAAVQDVLPSRARGSGTSIIAFGNTLIGLGLGPTLVAFAAEGAEIGQGLTIVALPAVILAVGLLWLAGRNARSLEASE